MSRETYFVKPVEGRDVPKPNGYPLKPEGETLPKSKWWGRRRRDGDVTISEKAPTPSKKPKVKEG